MSHKWLGHIQIWPPINTLFLYMKKAKHSTAMIMMLAVLHMAVGRHTGQLNVLQLGKQDEQPLIIYFVTKASHSDAQTLNQY